MFSTIAQFEEVWSSEMQATQRVLHALTDESLAQQVADGHRTIGRIAWHIVTTIPEMMERTGLKLDLVKADAPLPSTAEQIERAYASVAKVLLEKIKEEWQDDTLSVEDDMYGEKWARRYTLMALIHHEIHHRGQISVLMRQAGLKVPSIYGPAKEDWVQYGMKEPEI